MEVRNGATASSVQTASKQNSTTGSNYGSAQPLISCVEDQVRYSLCFVLTGANRYNDFALNIFDRIIGLLFR